MPASSHASLCGASSAATNARTDARNSSCSSSKSSSARSTNVGRLRLATAQKPWGARGSRAERVAAPATAATDPKNLNRVMPAEGIGTMAARAPSETVVVVTGGDPSTAARAGLAGRRPTVDRRRLRRRRAPRRSASPSTSPSATSTRSTPAGAGARRGRRRAGRAPSRGQGRHRPRAGPRRRRRLGADADPRARRPRRPPRPPAGQRAAARRRRPSAASTVVAQMGAARVTVDRATAPSSPARAGDLVTLLPVARARPGRHAPRASSTRCADEDLDRRHHPRRQQRAHRGHRRRPPREGVLLAVPTRHRRHPPPRNRHDPSPTTPARAPPCVARRGARPRRARVRRLRRHDSGSSTPERRPAADVTVTLLTHDSLRGQRRRARRVHEGRPASR